MTFMEKKLMRLREENKSVGTLGSDFVPHRSRLQKEQDKAKQLLAKQGSKENAENGGSPVKDASTTQKQVFGER